ncbi:LOW QUALITY PROTEIN: hypothetical protein V2J09_014629 [Rumex salicifolius]
MIPPNAGNKKTPFGLLLTRRLIALFIFSLLHKTLSLEICPTSYCPSAGAVSSSELDDRAIRFPFMAAGSNSSGRCGYPGFELTCDSQNLQPVLTLPSSGDFTVQAINYVNQVVLVSDPENCLPKRILKLKLAGTPFSGSENRNHTFVNCTNLNSSSSVVMAAPIPCLSGGNHTVYVTYLESAVDSLVGSGQCRVMNSVWSPSMWPLYESSNDSGSGPDLDRAGMALGWDSPDCSNCERHRGSCGFVGDSGLDVGCSVSNITRSEFSLCPTSYYDGGGDQRPPIRFSFTTGGSNHSRRCGYPGFHLHCDQRTQQPTVSLSSSGNFTVQVIDYSNQLIWMSDPERCLPKRILALDLTGSPGGGPIRRGVAVTCLSGDNYTVYVTFRESTVEFLAESGRSPVMWPVYRDESGSDLGTLLYPLTGTRLAAESVSAWAGFAGSYAIRVLTSDAPFPSRSKYGLILGLGIPGFILMVGLTLYFSGRLRSYNQRGRQLANTEFSPSVFPQPAVVMVGLDDHTIESYPKTLLGEGGRLPNPSNVICAICLSDYEAKEMLRTIPECNHYFHAHCIDEWLRLKGTCPLCRNSPGK